MKTAFKLPSPCIPEFTLDRCTPLKISWWKHPLHWSRNWGRDGGGLPRSQGSRDSSWASVTPSGIARCTGTRQCDAKRMRPGSGDGGAEPRQTPRRPWASRRVPLQSPDVLSTATSNPTPQELPGGLGRPGSWTSSVSRVSWGRRGVPGTDTGAASPPCSRGGRRVQGRRWWGQNLISRVILWSRSNI